MLALLAMLLAGCAAAPSSGDLVPTPSLLRGPLQFAGDVPWNSAVLDRDGRTLHLLADRSRFQGQDCSAPEERTSVQETSSLVTITVAGYAEPLPAGAVCTGVGFELQPETVRLATPLHGRRLVDPSDGSRRTVLGDAAVPTLARVPAGYVSQPLTWADEGPDQHTASRTWQSEANRVVFLRLTVGLPTRFFTFAGPWGKQVGSMMIDGRSGTVDRSENPDQTIVTVRWTTASGQQRELQAFGTSTDHLPVARIEALARSVVR